MSMFSNVSNAASDIGDAMSSAGEELGRAAAFCEAVGERAWDNFAFAWIDPILAENDGGIEGVLRAAGTGALTAMMLSPYEPLSPATYLVPAAVEIAVERGWIDPSISSESPLLKAGSDADRAFRRELVDPVWEGQKDIERSLRQPYEDAMVFGPTNALMLVPFAAPLGNYKAAETIVDAGIRYGVLDPWAGELVDTGAIVDAILDTRPEAEKAVREWALSKL